jgi:hypothetical protein
VSLLLGTALALTIVVVALGLGPALALGDSRRSVAVLAPAVTGIVCAVAVALSLLTRTPLLPWLVGLGLTGWALGLRYRSPFVPAVDATGPLLAATVVALLPVLLIDYPATVGDARSNFWLHAAWFHAGGGTARAAMASPAFEYSHPAYPPLVPAVIATVWQGWHEHDRHVALRIGQLLTAYGAVAVAYATARCLRVRGTLALLLAPAVAWLVWSAKVEVGMQGLLDLTWALPAAAACVLVLAGDGARRTMVWGAVFAAVAAFTKTEGQVAVLVLSAVAAVRFRREWRALVPLAAAVVGAIGLWAVVVRPSENDRGDWSKLTSLFAGGTEVNERLGDSASRLVEELGLLVLAGVLVVVAIVALARWAGTPVRQRGLLSLLAVAAGFSAFTVVTFAVRPEEIDFLLSVAAYRTVIFIRVLVVVDVVLALVAGARALGLIPDAAPVVTEDGPPTADGDASRVPA